MTPFLPLIPTSPIDWIYMWAASSTLDINREIKSHSFMNFFSSKVLTRFLRTAMCLAPWWEAYIHSLSSSFFKSINNGPNTRRVNLHTGTHSTDYLPTPCASLLIHVPITKWLYSLYRWGNWDLETPDTFPFLKYRYAILFFFLMYLF